MKAEIICVGTELLLGDIVNTNAVFLSKELANLGINVYYQTVVGDNGNRLRSTFLSAYNRSDVILVAGGLGPTQDDLTKEVVTKSLGLKMTLNLPWLIKIKEMFRNRKIKMPVNNIKQALIPKGGMALPNDNGTACGIYIPINDKHVFLLPGPPRELEPMFTQVKHILAPLSHIKLQSRVIKTYGIGESKLVQIIDDLISEQTDPTIAPLAKKDGVHLRITTKENIKGLSDITEEIVKRLGAFVWSVGDEELNSHIINMLLNNGLTLSLVESCTGGLVASALTDIPGSSRAVIESQVLYTLDAKSRFLGCSISEIPSHGIDKELTEKLAIHSLIQSNSNISLAITGALGPSSPEGVQVGEVYISIANSNKIRTSKFNFSGSRETIKERSLIAALHLIRQTIGEICNEG